MSDQQTVDDKLSDITQMLARIEERQIASSGRVDQLETEMRGVQRQVNLAHGGLLVIGILASIVAYFKSVLSSS